MPGWVTGRDRLIFVGWWSDTSWVFDAKLAAKTTGKHSGTLRHPPHQWSELDTLPLVRVNFSLCLFLCPWDHLSYQRPLVITRPCCNCFPPGVYINFFLFLLCMQVINPSLPLLKARHIPGLETYASLKHNYFIDFIINFIDFLGGKKSIWNI